MSFKNVWKICLILIIGIGISSCSDDEEQQISVKLLATPAIEDAYDGAKATGMEVVFTNMRDMNAVKGTLNADGTAEVMLYKGVYNISIESKTTNTSDVEVIYTAKLENCAINTDGQQVKVDLHIFPANTNNESFIFSELFFNGEVNGVMMHPDQYMVIFNPTQEDLYADGLCFATAYQYSVLEKEAYFDEYMNNNKIPISGFFTIPGSGKEHLVKAGDKIVIAFTAINHPKENGYENAVDLSGADFEVYDGPESSDVDVPEVPNVILTETLLYHPRGFFSNMLFKLENGNQNTIEAFFKANTKEFTFPDGSKEMITSVDADKIVDGVVTGDRPIVTRNLPESVDRGFILVSGCHRNELVIRKEIKVGSQIFYEDTNNSENDFVIKIGQTPYPKGWRTGK